jgi:hypothetical protein
LDKPVVRGDIQIYLEGMVGFHRERTFFAKMGIIVWALDVKEGMVGNGSGQ